MKEEKKLYHIFRVVSSSSSEVPPYRTTELSVSFPLLCLSEDGKVLMSSMSERFIFRCSPAFYRIEYSCSVLASEMYDSILTLCEFDWYNRPHDAERTILRSLYGIELAYHHSIVGNSSIIKECKLISSKYNNAVVKYASGHVHVQDMLTVLSRTYKLPTVHRLSAKNAEVFKTIMRHVRLTSDGTLNCNFVYGRLLTDWYAKYKDATVTPSVCNVTVICQFYNRDTRLADSFWRDLICISPYKGSIVDQCVGRDIKINILWSKELARFVAEFLFYLRKNKYINV